MPLTEQEAVSVYKRWVEDCNTHFAKPGKMNDFSWAWKWCTDPDTFVYIHALGTTVGKAQTEEAVAQVATVGLKSEVPAQVKARMNFAPGVHIIQGPWKGEYGAELLPGAPKSITGTVRLYLDDAGKLTRVHAQFDRPIQQAYWQAAEKAMGPIQGGKEAEAAVRKILENMAHREAGKYLETMADDAVWLAPTGIFRGKEEIGKGIEMWLAFGIDGGKPLGDFVHLPHHRAGVLVEYSFGHAPSGFPVKTLKGAMGATVDAQGKITRINTMTPAENELEEQGKVFAWAMKNAGTAA
ncbi:hypothetical protein DFJ74DRAFT_707952 [Hyaloraphidium curvatum]|nr:hypothetical protein DFJ74DRAFT_707952 [Hyaloraphidium curvatum]